MPFTHKRKTNVCVLAVLAGLAGAALLPTPARAADATLGVVPILIGPLQALLAILPAIMVALATMLVQMFKPQAISGVLKLMWRKKLGTLIFAGCVVGVVYGVSFVSTPWGSSDGGNVKIDRGSADWPVARGGVGRRGAVAGKDADATVGGVVWKYNKDFKTFYSSPAVVGNLVYVSAADKGIYADRGAVICLDADSGTVVWKFSPKDYRATYSSPVVLGKYLVVGEGLHFIRDARIFCLDAENGTKLWEFQTKSHVESTPCLYEGKAYVGAGDDGLYCMDLATGKEKWHLPGEQYKDCETSPVAADGKVYWGLGMWGNAAVCADAETGKEIWRTETPYPVFGSPTLVKDKVIIGMGNGNLAETAEMVREKEIQRLRKKGAGAEEINLALRRLAPGGAVWCLDASKGLPLWKFDLKQNVLGVVAAADDRLYFGCQDGVLYCLDMDGKVLSQWNTNEQIVTSPAVGNELAFFQVASGRLYGVDRVGLRPVWETSLGAPGLFLSSPVAARGHVYVGTAADGLQCIGRPQKRTPIWAGALGGPGQSGWADRSQLSPQGAFNWRLPKDKEVAEGATSAPALKNSVSAPAAYLEEEKEQAGRKVREGVVYVGFQGERVGLAKLTLDRKTNRSPAENWFCPLPNPPVLSPAGVDDRIYVVDGQPGQAGRKLRCLSIKDGSVLWTHEVSDKASGEFVVIDRALAIVDKPVSVGQISLGHYDPPRLLYIVDKPNTVSCLSLTGNGQALWSVPVTAPVGSPAALGNLVLVAGASGLTGIERGNVVWTAQLDSPATTGVIAAHGMLAVGTEKGVEVRSIHNRALLWSAASWPVRAALVADDEYLGVVTAGGEVIVYDWTGAQAARFQGAASFPPMLCGDAVLYGTPQGLERGDLATGKNATWLKTDWLGQITAGPIIVGGHAYFGMDQKGLVCAKPRK